MTANPESLIGTVVDVEFGGRTIDAVVQDVDHVHSALNWQAEITVARNGSQWRVPPTAIVS